MKEYLPAIFELLKYTVPALVVLWATYLIVKKFTVMELERKQLAILKESQGTTIRLRLQAYERMALLMERIQPRNLLPRVYVPGLTVREFQSLLVQSINTEFEHNLAQQIYVSWGMWQTIQSVKEQELNMLNQMAQQCKPDEDGRILQTRIVDFLVSSDEIQPTQMALQMIHDEAKKVLSYSALG